MQMYVKFETTFFYMNFFKKSVAKYVEGMLYYKSAREIRTAHDLRENKRNEFEKIFEKSAC